MMFAYAADSIYSKASDWSKAEIQSAYEKLSGELITLPATNQFKDTKNPQILKAYSIGITNGTSDTTFDPDAITNREHVAAMFGRSIQKLFLSIKLLEL